MPNPSIIRMRGFGNLGSDDQVFVKDGEKCWFVKLADVRLFESDGNYIKVYFDHFKPMIHKSLNALDERLDDRAFSGQAGNISSTSGGWKR
jgi:DNA-binding LytR/AlgR family response regulator